jgi:hypothetical protein
VDAFHLLWYQCMYMIWTVINAMYTSPMCTCTVVLAMKDGTNMTERLVRYRLQMTLISRSSLELE